MSRTFRRKKAKPCKWVTHDYVRVDDSWRWTFVPRSEKDLRYNVARFHSDCGSGDYFYRNAPKWYCKMIDRIKRAKDNHELRRIMNTGDYEDYNFNPRYKDAGWNYW